MASSAARIRAVMLGTEADGVVVVRQARRLHDGDSDEIALVDAGGSWWVARRVSSKVSVYAYIGDAEAEEGFERLSSAALQGGSAWTEAAQALLRPVDTD